MSYLQINTTDWIVIDGSGNKILLDSPIDTIAGVAAQTVPAFAQSFTGIDAINGVAAQTIQAFGQSFTAGHLSQAVASQTLNPFGVFLRVVHTPSSQKPLEAFNAGGRPRRAL